MRFELTYFDCDYVTDHLNNIDYPVIDKESMFEVVALLNVLHEENQSLLRKNGAMEEEIECLSEENEKLKERNDFLRKQLDRVCIDNEIMGDKLKQIGRIL